MSISDKVEILDVRGDGSCFYRSIYNSIKNTKIMNRIIPFFNYLYNDLEIVENPSEKGFVKFTRLLISKLILSNNDYKIVKDVYNNLKSLTKDEYKEVITSFPDWFDFTYSSMQKISEDYFRIFIATNVKKTKNWVSQIEIEILQNLLAEIDLTLIIINNNIKRGFRFKKNEIYILNIGEYHYKSILPAENNNIYYDTHDDYPKISYRKVSSPKALRINNKSYSSPKKSKSKVNLKECEKGKIRHPVSNRCVLINGDKGKEALKLLGKKSASPVLKLKGKASPKKSKSKVNLKECEKGKIKHPVSNRCVLINGAKGREALKLLNKNSASPVLKLKCKASPKKSKSKVNLKECEKGKIRHPVSNRCVLINGAKGREALKLLGSRS
jgi:hypothetical protein